MTPLYKQNRQSVNDDNLIPLINIVFLMLIFFLVAGQISAKDSALFTAPQSTQENKLDDSEMTILLAADESIWVNNEPVNEELLVFLQQHAFSYETKVVLKVDANLKAPILDPVLLSLQSLGIQKLKLVTIARDS